MRRGIVITGLVSSALALLCLTGCADDPAARPAPVPVSPIATAVPTASPSPTPTGSFGTGRLLDYSCDELVDPDVIASLDKNLDVDHSYQPAESTSAERAVAIRGTACRWKDAATGASLIVSAAHPDPSTFSAISVSTARYATRTNAFGSDVTGYLVNTQAEIFTRNGYWATATSPLFADQKIARAIMAAVENALPIG